LIIIAVSPGDEQHCRDQVLADLDMRPEVILVAGGDRRQDSVCNALAAVPAKCDVVLIHDAARPFAEPEIIDAAARAAFETGAATAAVPVKDTIMQLDAGKHDQPQTLDRDTLYAIQTPQAFRPDVIRKAHDNARQTAQQATDDASLVRSMGQPVEIVKGSYYNIKITTAVDLVYAAALLRARGIVQ
jgi:2-C-methyl-D-erythritol 4-phosphate cytidylyltransferase